MNLFKKKPRNRRLETQYVLDVKLCSLQTRNLWMRRSAIFAGSALVVAAVAGACWWGGQWMLSRFLFDNDSFAVGAIEVQTDGRISPEQIKRWASVPRGANLLSLDLARVRRDLELVPWVASASVERILPRTLEVRVSEREPVARVLSWQKGADGTLDQHFLELDESGFLMEPINPAICPPGTQMASDLPLISGIPLSELRIGRTLNLPQVKEALEFLAEFDASPISQVVDVLRIDVASPEILEIYTSQGGDIVFSSGEFQPQLHRWKLVFDVYQREGKAISMLDLSISNNLPVRLVESRAVPSLQKSAKPQRNRKKHV